MFTLFPASVHLVRPKSDMWSGRLRGVLGGTIHAWTSSIVRHSIRPDFGIVFIGIYNPEKLPYTRLLFRFDRLAIRSCHFLSRAVALKKVSKFLSFIAPPITLAWPVVVPTLN